jgi:hypothetical protein
MHQTQPIIAKKQESKPFKINLEKPQLKKSQQVSEVKNEWQPKLKEAEKQPHIHHDI